MADSKRELGQVFTPNWIVKMVLDNVGYSGKCILEKRVIEPSFGDGNFLVEICRRIIAEGREQGKSAIEVAECLENNVFGVEKDEGYYQKALERLNDLISDEGITGVTWHNLQCGDTLLLYQELGQFEYVVGNPPYVRLLHTDMSYRALLRGFEFAENVIDLYIIFYEIGLKMLSEKGKLGYVSSNSFLKAVSCKRFRRYMSENKLVEKIIDFGSTEIFSGIDTYTCIMILNNSGVSEFTFDKYEDNTQLYSTRMTERYLTEGAWLLGTLEDMQFLQENDKKKKLCEVADVYCGCGTYADKVFVGNAFLDKECTEVYNKRHTDTPICTVYFKVGKNVIQIESNILHRTLKGSRCEGVQEGKYIIFPYHDDGSDMTEEELQSEYPLAYAWLVKNKEVLSKKETGKNTNWWLYGRKQGVLPAYNKKLTFKTIVKRGISKVKIYLLEEDVVVYSGLFIVPKDNIQIEKLKEVLESEDFARYCSLACFDKAGGYMELGNGKVKGFGVC